MRITAKRPSSRRSNKPTVEQKTTVELQAIIGELGQYIEQLKDTLDYNENLQGIEQSLCKLKDAGLDLSSSWKLNGMLIKSIADIEELLIEMEQEAEKLLVDTLDVHYRSTRRYFHLMGSPTII